MNRHFPWISTTNENWVHQWVGFEESTDQKLISVAFIVTRQIYPLVNIQKTMEIHHV